MLFDQKFLALTGGGFNPWFPFEFLNIYMHAIGEILELQLHE